MSVDKYRVADTLYEMITEDLSTVFYAEEVLQMARQAVTGEIEDLSTILKDIETNNDLLKENRDELNRIIEDFDALGEGDVYDALVGMYREMDDAVDTMAVLVDNLIAEVTILPDCIEI